MGEGSIFSLCVSSHLDRGGTPSANRGVYPFQGQDGGTLSQVQIGGTLSQVQIGVPHLRSRWGYPIPGLDGGYPIQDQDVGRYPGVPPPHQGLDRGTPSLRLDGVPPIQE